MRDNQRSAVYAWERAAVAKLTQVSMYEPDFKTIEECQEFAAPIWAKERGRVGLAKQKAPNIESSSWGQRRALAHSDHRITLPRWARSRWVILHELAHRLTPKDEAHGPRFVGVLIGLASRHLDYDADALIEMAEEMGVKYYVRSIGMVPVLGPAERVLRAVKVEGPMTEMDLACWLDITYMQVRGAALALTRKGKVRWLRNKLVLLDTNPKEMPA